MTIKRTCPILKTHSVIPWEVAKKAHEGYERKYGKGYQSLERIAERGGFGIAELDEFYPKWRLDPSWLGFENLT